MFDTVDLSILSILQSDARASNAEIARRLGMAPSGILERIRKLEKRGVILGYEARVAPAAVGLGLTAFIFVQIDDRSSDQTTGEALARLPEVQEVHHIAGEDCYLLKVRTRSTETLGKLLRESLGGFDSVRRTRTTIVLGTLKETGCVPIPAAGEVVP